MNDEDRRSLQISRSFIVKNIENIEDITEELFSRDVFTESMKSDVNYCYVYYKFFHFAN
jgi:hypothetical protein